MDTDAMSPQCRQFDELRDEALLIHAKHARTRFWGCQCFECRLARGILLNKAFRPLRRRTRIWQLFCRSEK